MKTISFMLLVLLPGLVVAQSTPPPALDGSWKKQTLIDDFWAEGATSLDVNKDGSLDVIYGPYWFAGPDYTKRTLIYPDTTRTKAQLEDGTEKEIIGFGGISPSNRLITNHPCWSISTATRTPTFSA